MEASSNQEVARHTVAFRPEVLDALRHDRSYHPHPRVPQKKEVLWLKSKGFTHEEIAALADVSRRTVQRSLDAYLTGGLLAGPGSRRDVAEGGDHLLGTTVVPEREGVPRAALRLG